MKKQLALPEGTEVAGHSKFAHLGADSLDTVCDHCSSAAISNSIVKFCVLLCKLSLANEVEIVQITMQFLLTNLQVSY